MTAMRSSSNYLYEQILAITEDYLGPAAKRFIDRQIENHFGKKPAQITAQDLDPLIGWVKISLSMITSNHAAIREYTDRLLKLKNEPRVLNGRQTTR